MIKEAYDKKLNEMKGQEVTMENIFEGLIFRCSWGGMADYFEVIGKTAKSLKLREIQWETCANPDPNDDSFDPTYRWTRIVRDEKGDTVPELDFDGKEKIKMVRVKTRKDGSIYFRSPNYDGAASVSVCWKDYMHMYWG